MFTRMFDIDNDHMMVKGIPGHWDVYVECKDPMHNKFVWGYLDTSDAIDEIMAATKIRHLWIDGEHLMGNNN